MKRNIILFIIIISFFNCKKDIANQNEIKYHFENKLKELNIQGSIKIISQTKYEIIFNSPYKTVLESHQKLLLDFIVSSYDDLNLNSDSLIFIVYLDKEKDILKNNFLYSKYDLKKIKEAYIKDDILKKIHEYILTEFDKNDIIRLDNFIKDFYQKYAYKDDIYNSSFLELISSFRSKDNSRNSKAISTILLLYGTSKHGKTEYLKDIEKQLTKIWNIGVSMNIDVALKENFGND